MIQIIDMLPSKTEYYYRGGDVGVFGTLIYDVVRQIPYNHASQIKLVQFMHMLEDKVYTVTPNMSC